MDFILINIYNAYAASFKHLRLYQLEKCASKHLLAGGSVNDVMCHVFLVYFFKELQCIVFHSKRYRGVTNSRFLYLNFIHCDNLILKLRYLDDKTHVSTTQIKFLPPQCFLTSYFKFLIFTCRSNIGGRSTYVSNAI